MASIIVNKDLCNKCSTCQTVCIMGIIEIPTQTTFPTISDEKSCYCIKCGHCESFCEQKALTLNFKIEEKTNTEKFVGQIEHQKLALYIKNRRSIRHFKSSLVDRKSIDQLIDIARYAASGGNSQTVQWLVIYTPAKVKQIAELTIDWMRSIQQTTHILANYVPVIISKWDEGKDLICHNAPHLIFAHTPYVESFEDQTDSIIAMTHIDILAPSLGIGTCWAGFVKMAVDSYQPLKDFLQIPEGRKTSCPMLLGYSKYKTSSIPRRNSANVTYR